MNKIIISTQAESRKLCLKEIKDIYKQFKLVKWLDKGIGLGEIDCTYKQFSDIIKESKPTYLRHMFDVQNEINLSEENQLLKVLEQFSEKLDISTTYAIQGYVIFSEHNKKSLNEVILNELLNKGFVCNNQYPKQVISYVVFNNVMYIGLNSAKLNLSNWTLGMRRYQKYENQISRAEFKLLEAIETFNINLENYENALDLGASPGGWSKVLLEKGLQVTAVDPAKLNIKHDNLTHYKGLAEDFVKTNKNIFDIVVNDMKMDVCESAKIMVGISSKLKENGIAIVTYKLPKNKSVGKILDGNRILNEKYTIIHQKQLFHNRNEITVVLEKK